MTLIISVLTCLLTFFSWFHWYFKIIFIIISVCQWRVVLFSFSVGHTWLKRCLLREIKPTNTDMGHIWSHHSLEVWSVNASNYSGIEMFTLSIKKNTVALLNDILCVCVCVCVCPMIERINVSRWTTQLSLSYLCWLVGEFFSMSFNGLNKLLAECK